MNPERTSSRCYILGLFLLSGVLVLGIVQWSFLPILIQTNGGSSSAILEMSTGHSSKFAAPFKWPFGDGLSPCLARARVTVRRIASRIPHQPEARISGNDEVVHSYHQLRAPPSA